MPTVTHYPIYFKAIVWDLDAQKSFTDEGFVTMPSMSDALTYLSEYYGRELITLKVHPLAEGPILLSSLDEYRAESEI